MQETSEAVFPLQLAAGLSLATIVLLGIVTVVQRDIRRSAIIAVLTILALTTYGYWFEPTFDHRLGFTVVVLAVVVIGAVTTRASPRAIGIMTLTLNVVAIALVLANMAVIIHIAPVGHEPAAATQARTRPAMDRDVWYIVPDRHPSIETLTGLGMPIADLRSEYRSRGFDLLDQARSNYPDTRRSLAAAWNAQLLPDDNHSMTSAIAALQDPLIGRAFEEAGYEYVHLGSWFDATDSAASASTTLTLSGSSEFYEAFEWKTIIPALRKFVPIGVPGFANRRLRHHAHAEHQLDVLDDLASRDGPGAQFVLAHLLLPHPDYVFRADGSYRSVPVGPQDRHAAYVEHLAFTHDRLLGIIDTLLAREEPPIVLIMSDEGVYPYDVTPVEKADFLVSEMTDRQLVAKVSVFAALFDPEGDVGPLPEAITPAHVTRRLVAGVLDVDVPPVPDHVMQPKSDGVWTVHTPEELPDALLHE